MATCYFCFNRALTTDGFFVGYTMHRIMSISNYATIKNYHIFQEKSGEDWFQRNVLEVKVVPHTEMNRIRLYKYGPNESI